MDSLQSVVANLHEWYIFLSALHFSPFCRATSLHLPSLLLQHFSTALSSPLLSSKFLSHCVWRVFLPYSHYLLVGCLDAVPAGHPSKSSRFFLYCYLLSPCFHLISGQANGMLLPYSLMHQGFFGQLVLFPCIVGLWMANTLSDSCQALWCVCFYSHKMLGIPFKAVHIHKHN